MTTAVDRRRKGISADVSLRSSGVESIGGCLIISVKNVSSMIDRLIDEQPFLRERPLGIESVSGIHGREIDLYRYLRERECFEHVYNPSIRNDRFIAGHHLTPGGLGCLESHALTWHRVLRANRSSLFTDRRTAMK